jgi:hypothetical protein
MQAQEQMYEPETTGKQVSSWAIGFTYFAAIMMMLVGAFHMIAGISGIVDDEFYVLAEDYTFKADATTWGWIHLIGGIIVVLAGFGLLSGALWARIIAIFVAVLSIIANFAFIPWYPAWSILMIGVGIGVIWALTAHGRDVAVAKTATVPSTSPTPQTTMPQGMAPQGMAQGTAQRMSPAGQGGSDPEPTDRNGAPPMTDQSLSDTDIPQQLQDRPPGTPS